MEKRIRDRGYYPIRLTRDEVDAWSADPALVDARFKAEMLALGRALDGARRRAARRARASAASSRRPTTTCSRSTRSSRRPTLVELGESNTIALDGFTLVSTGWANPTPWNTFRELPEDELRARIDGLVAEVADPRRAIFNFHAPPYGSNLDAAPKLDADMNYVSGGQALVPVGSKAVRESILAYGPVLSLHGHIHEGRGRGEARPHPGGQPGQLVRGRCAPGGHRRPRREERRGEALSADQRLTNG